MCPPNNMLQNEDLSGFEYIEIDAIANGTARLTI
jgi:hypothetical protein